MGAVPPKEALLIANGKYSHFAGLAHPGPDAAKLASALEGLGFRVRMVSDANREQMLDAIAEFERGLRNTGAIAFFHYGGHCVQVNGRNYLIPANADIPDEKRVATRAVELDEVMTALVKVEVEPAAEMDMEKPMETPAADVDPMKAGDMNTEMKAKDDPT
jgi:uncharacterized caspase-like protein